MYVGGQWRKGGGGTDTAVSPSSGQAFAQVSLGSPADVDDADGGRRGGLSRLGGGLRVRPGGVL